MKNTVYLNFLWKKRKLELIQDQYQNNNKLYLWLYDIKENDYFCDITCNDPNCLLAQNQNIIDNDFIQICFNNNIENLKNRLKENLNIKDFDYYFWYYTFTL